MSTVWGAVSISVLLPLACMAILWRVLFISMTTLPKELDYFSKSSFRNWHPWASLQLFVKVCPFTNTGFEGKENKTKKPERLVSLEMGSVGRGEAVFFQEQGSCALSLAAAPRWQRESHWRLWPLSSSLSLSWHCTCMPSKWNPLQGLISSGNFRLVDVGCGRITCGLWH